MDLSWRLSWLAALPLWACSTAEPQPAPGQIGGVPGACEAGAQQSLAIDEPCPLGFSAATLLDFAGGSHALSFVWDQGGTTGATLTIAPPSAVRFADLGAPPGQDPQLYGEVACADHLELDTTVTLDTADGAFAESFALTLLAASSSRAFFSTSVEPASIAGSYVFDERPADTYDEVASLTFNAVIEATGATGDVHAQLVKDAGDGALVSAENVLVGSFAP